MNDLKDLLRDATSKSYKLRCDYSHKLKCNDKTMDMFEVKQPTQRQIGKIKVAGLISSLVSDLAFVYASSMRTSLNKAYVMFLNCPMPLMK